MATVQIQPDVRHDFRRWRSIEGSESVPFPYDRFQHTMEDPNQNIFDLVVVGNDHLGSFGDLRCIPALDSLRAIAAKGHCRDFAAD